MRFPRITLFLLLCLAGATARSASLLPLSKFDAFQDLEVSAKLLRLTNGVGPLTGDVVAKSTNAILTADQAWVNVHTGEVAAEGNVRIQSDDIIWAGERVTYNFKTKQMSAQEFRAGRAPFFVGGEGLSGDITNQVYTATNGYITLDDYANPFLKVRAKKLTVSGEKFKGSGSTLRVGGVPVFYLPVYSHRLDAVTPAFTLTPGYRSRYGAYALGSYSTKWSDAVESTAHVDYRTKRGPGLGLDLDLHLGNWGDADIKYYYLHDLEPETNSFGAKFPDNRQLVEFNWLASPFTNTTFKSRVSYQTDEGVRREFFEGEYKKNVQPSTFVEARHFWDNFSLSAIASPRVNDFYTTVERLPELKLTAFRQQIGALPLYYESESRAGYLRQMLADTNIIPGLAYEATRADTYHQIVLPVTLFGWLNITPRAGGRFTYYSEADGPGATTKEINRTVFNTGAEASTKISRTWVGVRNGMFDVDGLRHIIEPSVNYVYVPRPDARPTELPQFDTELPSLHVLPIDYPDYNAIDAIDTQNVIRWGLRNRLQTKRNGEVRDLLDWNVFADWRLRPEPGQATFGDVVSELQFHPRTWLSLSSLERYDIDHSQLRMSFNSVTLQPNTTWHLRLGYLYLRDDFSGAPTAWGEGNNLLTSMLYFRVNENWGLRLAHYYDFRDHELEEQSYTLYRDFRSWTGALSFRSRQEVNGKADYTVSFTFSLKALPRYKLGSDTIMAEDRTGY